MDALEYFDAAVTREKAARKAVGRSEELDEWTIKMLGKIARQKADESGN